MRFKMFCFVLFFSLRQGIPRQTTVTCQRDKQDKLVTRSLQEVLLISSAIVGTATSHCSPRCHTFLKVKKQQGN